MKVERDHIASYQNMVAARHQDPEELATLYRDTNEIVLTIDGLQPEKATPLRIYQCIFSGFLEVPSPLEAGRRWPIGRLRGVSAGSDANKYLTALRRCFRTFRIVSARTTSFATWPNRC